MSDTNSIICFIRFNYKLVSSAICIVYLVTGLICVVKFTLTSSDGYPRFLYKLISGGLKTSIGLFISSALALFGMFRDSPFLIVPLMLMHIILFAMIKFLFCELVMETIHGPKPSLLFAIFLCISFVVVSIALGLTLWVLYCAFIQISQTVWPDSPISCRKRSSSSSSTSSTTQRNATNRDGNPLTKTPEGRITSVVFNDHPTNMIRLKRCCCGCELRTGTIVFLALKATFAVYQLHSVYMELKGHDMDITRIQTFRYYNMLYSSISGIVMIIACCTGIRIISKDRAKFLMPFICCQFVTLLFYIAFFLWFWFNESPYVADLFDELAKFVLDEYSQRVINKFLAHEPFVYTVVMFLLLTLNVYFTAVVYNYCVQLKVEHTIGYSASYSRRRSEETQFIRS